MLAAGQVQAGALAPAPQIIAEYDRSFIERFGAQTFGEMLDTGIIRYFFTGGRDLLILVNGRPYATTAHDLDTLPLSAIERIEVLRAESLGTLGGHAAVRGAFNLVLRKDLDGFDVRTVARMPSRDGGEARQGSVVWGGAIGDGGHLTVGVDILDREEIAGSTREHSRSEWAEGGSFAEARNVSVGGNTVYVSDTSADELRAVALGECDPAHGYTGPLSNPPGIDSGDKAPSMHHLHSTASQDHPYVRCVPESGPPPRTCDTANYRQVTRLTSGNIELEPSGSERRSIGAEARRGTFYFVADWYWLTTSDLPGQHDATWAMLNHPECPPGGGSTCIERAAGEITIHDNFANIVETEISGVNTRFGARAETGWGFVAMRGFWRYVNSSEERIAGEERPLPLPRNAVRIVTSAGRGDLTAFWAVNYRDEIESRWGDGRFSSWTGHDVTLDWRAPLKLENTRVTAGVYNVTDAKLSTNTENPSVTDGPVAAGWGRTFFATLNMRF